MNVPAVLVAAGALLASMLVFGLEPALALTRDTMSAQLSSEAGAAPPRRRRRQRAFIRWQVATSVCFFLIAAVLARLLVTEARHDSGVAIDELAMASVHFTLQGWDETARAPSDGSRAGSWAPSIGQLRSVAVSSGLPFGLQMTPTAQITTPDRPFVKGVHAETADVLVASPNIFSTLGVPIVTGRGFDERDDAAAARVGVVSEFTAVEALRNARRDREAADLQAVLRRPRLAADGHDRRHHEGHRRRSPDVARPCPDLSAVLAGVPPEPGAARADESGDDGRSAPSACCRRSCGGRTST